jgi:hypothetical protein
MTTLQYVPIPQARILSIDPVSKGFGFVVLEEDPMRLVDWGTSACTRTRDGIGSSLRVLIQRYRATEFRMPSPSTARVDSRRSALNVVMRYAAIAAKGLCPMRLISAAAVQRTFAPSGAVTKEEIANILVGLFPELKAKLPPARGVFDSEDARWAIFDAVALALATEMSRPRGFPG